MSMAPTEDVASGAVEPSPDRLHRLPLSIYHGIAEFGLLTPRDRVVLLDGLLVKKFKKTPPHVYATHQASDLIKAVLPRGWDVRKDNPISMPDGSGRTDSEPEPDLAVVRGDFETYADHHPGPADVALIVEVADVSLAEDRLGLRRYGWSKIPSLRIVNLVERVVEVYTGPSGPAAEPGYAHLADLKSGDRLPVILDGAECESIEVAQLFPKGKG